MNTNQLYQLLTTGQNPTEGPPKSDEEIVSEDNFKDIILTWTSQKPTQDFIATLTSRRDTILRECMQGAKSTFNRELIIAALVEANTLTHIIEQVITKGKY